MVNRRMVVFGVSAGTGKRVPTCGAGRRDRMGSRDALVGGGSAARGGLAWPVPIALGLDRLQPCDARFVPFSAHPSSGGGLLDHAAVIEPAGKKAAVCYHGTRTKSLPRIFGKRESLYLDGGSGGIR